MEDIEPHTTTVHAVLFIFVVAYALLLREIIKAVDFAVKMIALKLDPFSEASLAFAKQLQVPRLQPQQLQQEEKPSPSHPVKTRPKLSTRIVLPERCPSAIVQKCRRKKSTVKIPHQRACKVSSVRQVRKDIVSKSRPRAPKVEAATEKAVDRGIPLQKQEDLPKMSVSKKTLHMIALLLDDVYGREYGSAVVRSLPAGLKYHCWLLKFTKGLIKAEDKRSQALDGKLQAKKGKGTQRARFVVSTPRFSSSLRLDLSPRPDTTLRAPNTPTIKPRFRQPSSRERLRYWYYYLCLHKMEGKYAAMLMDAQEEPTNLVPSAKKSSEPAQAMVTGAGSSCSSPVPMSSRFQCTTPLTVENFTPCESTATSSSENKNEPIIKEGREGHYTKHSSADSTSNNRNANNNYHSNQSDSSNSSHNILQPSNSHCIGGKSVHDRNGERRSTPAYCKGSGALNSYAQLRWQRDALQGRGQIPRYMQPLNRE